MKTICSVLLIFVFVSLSGCESMQPKQTVSIKSDAQIQNQTSDLIIQKKQDMKEVMKIAEKRNYDIEKDPQWISWAYSGLNIKNIKDIPAANYREYSRFVENGNVFVMVHPSYYLFFHSKKPKIKRNPKDMTNSIVDIFLKENYADPILILEQQQQINEKNFMEYATTEEKLLILILPRDYRSSKNYTYARGYDEYARYINEIANGAQSILYLESESAGNGKLLPDDLIALTLFLDNVGAKSVLVGGGYVGRCQKEFYRYMSEYSIRSNYFIVPEISTFSPEDVSERIIPDFLNKNGINFEATSAFILRKTPGTTNLQHLSPQYIDSVINVSNAINTNGSLLPENNNSNQADADNQTEKPVETAEKQSGNNKEGT